MNRRVLILLAALLFVGGYTVRGASPGRSSQAFRKAINSPDKQIQAPFSDAILAGDTLYLSGKLGLDPKTGKAPDQIEDELKLLFDSEKATLTQAGMTMEDIVYVQVFCTDLSLYDKFNSAYKANFSKEFPARAFIGAGSLLRGGHFEMQAIAIKR